MCLRLCFAYEFGSHVGELGGEDDSNLDGLYSKLRQNAKEEGCTVERLIARELEAALSTDRVTPHRRVKLPIIHSKEPGTLHLDNERIFELIDFPQITSSD
jgi:hypothetical protein